MKGKRRNMKKISDTVKEMLAGILGAGFLIALIGLIFVPEKLEFLTGLAIGMVIAILMLFSMNYSIEVALEYDEKGAYAQYMKGFALRTLLFMVGFVGACFIGFWSMVACFLGAMCMKLSAYLQPYTKKLLRH